MRLPGVLYQQPTLAKPDVGVIYKFKGGGGWGWWGSGFGNRGGSMQKPLTLGDSPPPKVTNCWTGSGSWPTRGLGHWRCGCASNWGK